MPPRALQNPWAIETWNSEKITNSAVTTAAADGQAPLGAWPFANAVMTNFRSCIYKEPALVCIYKEPALAWLKKGG